MLPTYCYLFTFLLYGLIMSSKQNKDLYFVIHTVKYLLETSFSPGTSRHCRLFTDDWQDQHRPFWGDRNPAQIRTASQHHNAERCEYKSELIPDCSTTWAEENILFTRTDPCVQERLSVKVEEPVELLFLSTKGWNTLKLNKCNKTLETCFTAVPTELLSIQAWFF